MYAFLDPLGLIRCILPVVVSLLSSRYEVYVVAALHGLDLFCKSVLNIAREHHSDTKYQHQQMIHATDSSATFLDSDDSLDDNHLHGNTDSGSEGMTRLAVDLDIVMAHLEKLKGHSTLQQLCGSIQYDAKDGQLKYVAVLGFAHYI